MSVSGRRKALGRFASVQQLIWPGVVLIKAPRNSILCGLRHGGWAVPGNHLALRSSCLGEECGALDITRGCDQEAQGVWVPDREGPR